MAAERSRKGKPREGRRTAQKSAQEKGARSTAERRVGSRKERVLHTRISENLAENIYRVAEDLRVPASNLVRNVLEDAFSVVESVTDNVGDLIESILDEAERARARIARSVERTRRAVRRPAPVREADEAVADADEGDGPPEFPEVLGWQPMLLNHEQRCSDCGAQISKGERALVGMAASGLTSTYLCLSCMNARR
jgi:hypothetical protein